MTIPATCAIGEVQTSAKGAKSAPLRSEGKPIVWQSEWTSVLWWEPSSFGEDQGPRQNACFAMERDSEAWAAWDDFEKRCVGELPARWDDKNVKDRWQSCLKESRQGTTFLKRKLDLRNVRFWGGRKQDPEARDFGRLRVPGPRRGPAGLDHGQAARVGPRGPQLAGEGRRRRGLLSLLKPCSFDRGSATQKNAPAETGLEKTREEGWGTHRTSGPGRPPWSDHFFSAGLRKAIDNNGILGEAVGAYQEGGRRKPCLGLEAGPRRLRAAPARGRERHQGRGGLLRHARAAARVEDLRPKAAAGQGGRGRLRATAERAAGAGAAAAGGRHLPADEPWETVLQEQVLPARSTHPSGHQGDAAAGKNAGRAYERRDWLPANVLGGEASRQPDRLSEQQILQNVKQETLRLVAAGDEDRAAGRAPIMELSDETYFYDPEREWVVSSETAIPGQPRTRRRNRLRGLPRVSCQLHSRTLGTSRPGWTRWKPGRPSKGR